MGHPPLPSNVGQRKRITDIDGKTRFVTVLDEVTHVHSTDPEKVIYLQKVQFGRENRIEIRLGYYIIGKEAGKAGVWVWEQLGMAVPVADFEAVVRKASEKGWFDSTS